MRFLLNILTTLALRLRWFTLALVILLLGLGGVAAVSLNQELLPPVEFPQTVVLAQASGLTSEQVLNLLTERLEPAFDEIPEVVNLESQTTGSFGAVIQVFNDFGGDQEALRADLAEAIESVWLPRRSLTPPQGTAPEDFAAQLLADLSPELLLYLADQNTNFLFQLEPSVWELLSDEAVTAAAALLASQTQDDAAQASALERLVDKELVPQLQSLEIVGNVQLQGGQALPGEEASLAADVADTEPQSLLLRLPPATWEVIAPRIAGVDQLDQDAVDTLLQVEFNVPDEAPVLPESWQGRGFNDVTDLLELASLTRPVAGVLNDFSETGEISGALGQTDDLTVDDIERMLEIDPSIVEYFEAEQLVAMPPDVFAALPASFVDSLDGFSRDQLAAAELARSITGEDARPDPVDLPSQWRISPPQLLFFSFSDLPLATFSVTSTAAPTSATDDTSADTTSNEADTNSDSERTADDEQASQTSETARDLPEGPPLPELFSLFATFLSEDLTLDTADDLVQINLPAEAAAQFGADSIGAADLLNLLTQIGDLGAAAGTGGEEGGAGLPNPADLAEFLPALQSCGIGLLQISNPNFDFAGAIIGCLDADVVQYLVDNDPDFAQNLQGAVIEYFDESILQIDGISPRLPDAWDVLAEQPQFADSPLATADDVLALGDGSAAQVLNTINAQTPERFAGYEVRLFNSLTPSLVKYFELQEPDFWDVLDGDVVLKFSAEELAEAPLSQLDDATAQAAQAIIAGDAPSAFAELQAQYSTDLPPEDPDAPALNPEWGVIAPFYNIEMDSADDFFRFPEDFAFENAGAFINSFFGSAQGANFAVNILGNTPIEAYEYILERDAEALNNLDPRALRLLPADALALLPENVQNRAEEDADVFEPTNVVTRTNSNPSLFLTVFKTSDASTVAAYLEIEDLLFGIDEANDDIEIGVVFEQASFIQESITGVAREGTLGAIFAVIIILLFLSTRKKLAWRATIVIAVSIPLSVLSSLVLMHWLAPALNAVFAPLAADNAFFNLLATIFPEQLTLNIMTLSGLTVAVGRVVDDSIVVLENIFRQIQQGGEKREVVLQGTRDVAAAILTATSIAIVVFLPLGLTGGLIGSFFLPFGLAVMFALVGSFIVAVTVIPVLSYLVISEKDVPEDADMWLARFYLPVLRLAVASTRNRFIVLVLALLTLPISGVLLASRPATFLPDFGEPQVTITVSLEEGTDMLTTNAAVTEMEAEIRNLIPEENLSGIQTIIGSSAGQSIEAFLGGGASVNQNEANLTVALSDLGPDGLDTFTGTLRQAALEIFGGEDYVSVSGGTLSSGGFGGLALVVSGPQATLEEIDSLVIETMESIEGVTNVTSSLAAAAAGPDSETFFRVNQQSAISYAAELETDNTIGVTEDALQALQALPQVADDDAVNVSQGFNSQIQSEGFNSFPIAFSISISFMYVILAFSFRSPLYPLAVFGSLMVMPIGAAIGLTVADRTLGISALIGFLMLLGLVIANAVVLLDRVRSNMEERDMDLFDAIIEAGNRRLRPILMTSLATIIALTPLALGFSEGAIIASELGTVVIGGVLSSTVLTLIVVPVLYSLLYQLQGAILRPFRSGNSRK